MKALFFIFYCVSLKMASQETLLLVGISRETIEWDNSRSKEIL